MAMEWAHALATAQDAETKRRLDEVVLLLVPSLNPDGQIMETEWYRKHLGTRYEGGRMPWLYHHYVGHDNNRDWFMLTQKETRAMTRAVYHEWFPQIWLDEHQMGATGPRIFVPPYAEPVDTDIHPLVWREVNLIGVAHGAAAGAGAARAGVIYGYSYDAYWPGGTKNTAWWKNVIGPADRGRLRAHRHAGAHRAGRAVGRPQGPRRVRGRRPTSPTPGRAGWWRLRDIMDYERIASDALLETCADRREDFLQQRARARARRGRHVRPDGRLPHPRAPARRRLRARALAALMVEHGVEVKQAADGDVWIPLAQPYGRFVEEMFDARSATRRSSSCAGRDIVRPYDVSAWTLPLMMGVERGARDAARRPRRRSAAPAPLRSTAAAPSRWRPAAPRTRGS